MSSGSGLPKVGNVGQSRTAITFDLAGQMFLTKTLINTFLKHYNTNNFNFI